MIKFQEF